MSFAGKFKSSTLPKIERGMNYFARDVRDRASSHNRTPGITDTWNRSLRVYPTGAKKIVIGVSISALRANPKFKSGEPDGNYTEYVLSGGKYKVRTKDGGRKIINVTGNPESIGTYTSGMEIKDYVL